MKNMINLDDSAEFKKLARGYANQALHVLADIMENDNLAATARVSAAKIIIERAHGTAAPEINENKETVGEQLNFIFEIDA